MTSDLGSLASEVRTTDPTWGFLAKVRRLMQVYGIAWATHVSDEVTAVQFGVLVELHRQPGQDQTTLAQRLSMDKATAAGVVRRLTDRSLVQVLKDPADSRRKVLILTESGRAHLAALTPRVDSLRQEVFAVLRAAEQTAFIRSIETLTERLEDVRGTGR